MPSQPPSSCACPRPPGARGHNATHTQPPSPPRARSASPAGPALVRDAGAPGRLAPSAPASPRLSARVPFAQGQSFLCTASDSDEEDQRNARVSRESDPTSSSDPREHGHLTGESGDTNTSSSSLVTPFSLTAHGDKLDLVPTAPAPLTAEPEPESLPQSFVPRADYFWSDRFPSHGPQLLPDTRAQAQAQAHPQKRPEAKGTGAPPGQLPFLGPKRAVTELPSQARPSPLVSTSPQVVWSDDAAGLAWRAPTRSPARTTPPSAPASTPGLGAPSVARPSSSFSGPSGAHAVQLGPPAALTTANSFRRSLLPRRARSGSTAAADPAISVPTPTGRGGVFSRRSRGLGAVSPALSPLMCPQFPGGGSLSAGSTSRPQSAGATPGPDPSWVETFGTFSLNASASNPRPKDESLDPSHPDPHRAHPNPDTAASLHHSRSAAGAGGVAAAPHAHHASTDAKVVVAGPHSQPHAVEAKFVVATPPHTRGRGGVQAHAAHHRRNSFSADTPADRLLNRRQLKTRDRPATGGDSFSPTRFADIVEGEASSEAAGSRLTTFFGLARPNTASAAPQAADNEPRRLFSRRGSLYVPPRADPWADASSPSDSESAALPDVGEDGPAAYVSRAAAAVGRPHLVALLSARGDDYHLECLRVAMATLVFTGLPIDFALRKFLAEYELPKETQQIDRVLEAFSRRYTSSNPDLMTTDEAYITSFSLIMLHTDHFNPNNKNRMDLAAYLRNTQATSGLDSTVLTYLFDNTTASEFVYMHADRDRRPNNDTISVPKVLAPFSGGGKKVPDPCLLMEQGRVQDLQVPIDDIIWNRLSILLPPTCSALDDAQMKLSFVNAPVCEVSAAETEAIGVRVVKTSLLTRRDGKARLWGCILSSSQLLWFRDTDWCGALHAQISSQAGGDQTCGPWGEPTRISPSISYFLPDEITNLADAVAVQSADRVCGFDLYFEHAGQRRKISCDAASQEDAVDWINKINFCAAYRWAGIRKIDVFATEQRALLAKVERGEELPLAHVRQYWQDLLQRIDRAQCTYNSVKATLDHETQLARHLAVLAPLLKSTREAIETAAHALASQLGSTRLEWIKAQLRKSILQADLDAAHRAGVSVYLEVRGEFNPQPGTKEKDLPPPPLDAVTPVRRASWVHRLSLSLSPTRAAHALLASSDLPPPRSLGNSFVDALPPG